MTTSIWNTENSNENSFKFPFKKFSVGVILIVLIFVIWNTFISSNISQKYILVQQYENLTLSQIRIIEIVSGHSWQLHGAESSQVLDCLGRRGSTKSFKTRGFEDLGTNKNVPTNLWLCLDVDGAWYAIITTIFEKDIDGNQVARLVTAYRVAQDIFPTIDEYIQYIGQKWDARYISYVIGASQIYLQPK